MEEDFAKQAKGRRNSLAMELVDFLKHNKKWWLVPIIICMMLLGTLVALGSSGAAPFIYTLF